MSGLRIWHPTLRDATLVVTAKAKTSRGTDRDRYVTVDHEGYALVSEGIWRMLQRARTHGQAHEFVVVNEVTNPPAQILMSTADTRRRSYRQEADALREITPVGLVARTVPHRPLNIRSNQ